MLLRNGKNTETSCYEVKCCDCNEMEDLMYCAHCDRAFCSEHDWSNDCIGIRKDCNQEYSISTHLCHDCGNKYGQLCPSCFDNDDEDDDSDEGEGMER